MIRTDRDAQFTKHIGLHLRIIDHANHTVLHFGICGLICCLQHFVVIICKTLDALVAAGVVSKEEAEKLRQELQAKTEEKPKKLSAKIKEKKEEKTEKDKENAGNSQKTDKTEEKTDKKDTEGDI